MNKKFNKICWLFCNVIDNFGDIGVAWRLARELRTRLNWQIYLFLDDWDSLRCLAPDYANESGIILKNWQENEFADVENVCAPHVVIEMFACRLPENVLVILKKNQAIWLNWEYLSAENWAVRTHGMQSLQADGYAKYFWQMGFVPESGGLIREMAFRQPENLIESNALRVLLFGYQSEIWVETLRAWQALGWRVDVDCVGWQVGQSLHELGDLLAENGKQYILGSLKIRQIDFVPQQNFDDLLAQYDWLFVRGEDSFVRAQFSGKPFFWHIYPQNELAHLDKLAAFWDGVWRDDATWQVAHRALSGELNGAFRLPENERMAHWQALWGCRADWASGARDWQMFLLSQSDAVTRLANWCDLYNTK